MIDSQQVVYTEEDKKRIEAQKQKTKEGNKRTKEGKNLKKVELKVHATKNVKIIVFHLEPLRECGYLQFNC